MIGNDVIDLNAAKTESNWQRRGWLGKLFTSSEIDVILSGENAGILVWKAWSMKEAAYKCWNRNSNVRAFNPTQFECLEFPLTDQKGVICFNDLRFESRTTVNDDLVHTVAISEGCDFAKILEVASEELTMKNGIPFYDGRPASKSHHGRFGKCVALFQS